MRLVAIGDSITYGTHKYGVAKPNFVEILQKRLGLDELVNYGHNGISFSATAPNFPELAMCRYIDEMEFGDCVVVAGGTNDYGGQVELGSPADDQDGTFYGALAVFFKKLSQKYAGAKVYVVTPILRLPEGENSKGYTLSDYRHALKMRALEYGFPVIDGEQMPIDPKREEDRKRYMEDGLHPNAEGHKIYAEYLERRIREYERAKLCV